MSQEAADAHADKPWKRLLHGLGGAAAGAYGMAALHASGDPLLGKRTVYQGTSKRNWERIQHEGLKASHGGTGGAGEVAGSARAVERTRGYVHVTPHRDTGILYTHIATDRDVARRAAARELPHAEMAHLSRQPHARGKLVKIRMDYGKYHRAQMDPDLFLGLRTTEDILPEEIVGSRAKFTRRLRHTARQWPNYVRTHPRQFVTGVLALGVGAGSLALGARLLRRALQTRDRSPEQTLRRAALAAKLAAERGSGGLVKLGHQERKQHPVLRGAVQGAGIGAGAVGALNAAGALARSKGVRRALVSALVHGWRGGAVGAGVGAGIGWMRHGRQWPPELDGGDSQKRRKKVVSANLLRGALLAQVGNYWQNRRPDPSGDPKQVEQAVHDFMTRHDLYGKITLHPFAPDAGDARYSRKYNSVHYPRNNRFIALHELGHAADMAKFKPLVRRALFGWLPDSARLGARAVTYPLAFANNRLTDKLKGDRPESARAKMIDFVRNHPAAVIGAAHLPQLGKETSAWVRALRHLHHHEGTAGVKAGLKSLHAPFGSYLTMALAEMALANTLHRWLDWERSRKPALSAPLSTVHSSVPLPPVSGAGRDGAG